MRIIATAFTAVDNGRLVMRIIAATAFTADAA